MSALYEVRYQGVAGTGHGAFYIGRGTIVGIDVTGARYTGSYTDNGSVLSGTATLMSAGGSLVTGQAVPPGSQISISFSLPTYFDNGHFHPIVVGGKPVSVAFSKVGPVP